MHSTPIVINDMLLMACCSMYFGPGWSLLLFSFPTSKKFTVANYYDQFVPQVTAATRFFTWMTCVMLAAAVIMGISEWHHRLWAPAVVFGAVVAVTTLTVVAILPLNRVLANHVRDQHVLETTLRRWMSLNRIRVGLWTAQWLTMAVYLGLALAGR